MSTSRSPGSQGSLPPFFPYTRRNSGKSFERRKPLPEGFSRWMFECKAGPDQASARPSALEDLGRAIDEVANAGGAEVYLEILATPDAANTSGGAAAASAS